MLFLFKFLPIAAQLQGFMPGRRLHAGIAAPPIVGDCVCTWVNAVRCAQGRNDHTRCWPICCKAAQSQETQNKTQTTRCIELNPRAASAQSESRQRAVGQSLRVPIGFVHITKSGGSSVTEAVNCPDLRCYGHAATARLWNRLDMDSLVILRDPVSRFSSNFYYAKMGSDYHYSATEMMLPSKHTGDFQAFSTPGHMIDALASEGNGTMTQRAWRGVREREGGMAFRKQVEWLGNVSMARLHVVCYSGNHSKDIEQALRRAGSNCTLNSVIINRTGKYYSRKNSTAAFEASNTHVPLAANQTAWVIRQYSEDARLYRQHCEPHLAVEDLPLPRSHDPRWVPDVQHGVKKQHGSNWMFPEHGLYLDHELHTMAVG